MLDMPLVVIHNLVRIISPRLPCVLCIYFVLTSEIIINKNKNHFEAIHVLMGSIGSAESVGNETQEKNKNPHFLGPIF